MPKFVIERNIPGASKLTPAELQAISANSCGVLCELGPSIQCVHIRNVEMGDLAYQI